MEKFGIFHGHFVFLLPIYIPIICQFGIFVDILVYFPPFWLIVPRKIWHPCVWLPVQAHLRRQFSLLTSCRFLPNVGRTSVHPATKYLDSLSCVLTIEILELEGECTCKKTDGYPCKARQGQSPSWKTRLFTTTNFFVIMEGGSLAMLAAV
jgi:hypothetical protein